MSVVCFQKMNQPAGTAGAGRLCFPVTALQGPGCDDPVRKRLAGKFFKKNRFEYDPCSCQEISMPRTLVRYQTPSPLAMAKIMTITIVRAGWLSGCTTILRYITSPSRRERKTTIMGKLYFFWVMLISDAPVYAHFNDLVIYSFPGGHDINSSQGK
jgi:hypothetical protein